MREGSELLMGEPGHGSQKREEERARSLLFESEKDSGRPGQLKGPGARLPEEGEATTQQKSVKLD